MTDAFATPPYGLQPGAIPPVWGADLEQVRTTVQALQGAASLLQGAMEQRQGLWTEMRGAEQSLAQMVQQRLQAEQALQTAQALLERTARDIEQVRSEQSGLLADFDKLVQGALVRRGALIHEIADLERRRDDLTQAHLVPQAEQLVLYGMPQPHAARSASALPTITLQTAAPQTPAPEPIPQYPPLTSGPVSDYVPLTPDPAHTPERPEPIAPYVPIAPEPLQISSLAPRPAAPRAAPILGRRAPRWSGRWFGVRQIFTLLLSVLVLGLAVLLTPVSQVLGGLQFLAVMSGSMEPTIQVGGIVGVRPVPTGELQVGDVITFANQNNPDVLVTHRIVSVEARAGQTLLTTKGDANDSVDALATSTSRAVGRVDFTLPWLGYLMIWLAAPMAKAGILVVAIIGFALPAAVKRTPASGSYVALEREIDALLPPAA